MEVAVNGSAWRPSKPYSLLILPCHSPFSPPYPFIRVLIPCLATCSSRQEVNTLKMATGWTRSCFCLYAPSTKVSSPSTVCSPLGSSHRSHLSLRNNLFIVSAI
ncbi:hypothetical protein E2C01_009833 [Portunus trituberculatus]|uniref:Uncharacterized protein n=1 Tax=Portunus trituberculatus TaxID=210409 RepID=A0A5B7D6S2_PORTR|nr:hypothetical protein [Portunus trituberculatus]